MHALVAPLWLLFKAIYLAIAIDQIYVVVISFVYRKTNKFLQAN